MIKIYTFSILFSLCLFAYSQAQQEYFKISNPKSVPLNSSFDISFITSNSFPEADTLELFIMPGERISLNSVRLNSFTKNTALDYQTSTLDNYDGIAYKININLKDTILSQGTFFQVLMNFSNDGIENSNINFLGIFKNNGKVLGYLRSEKNNNSNLIEEKLSFYKPQKTAERSLLLSNNSSLKYEIKIPDTDKNFLAEFWLKLNDSGAEVLKIKKGNSDFNISTNIFQVISCFSKNNHQEYANPVFISLKSWNHISILFSFKNNKLYFYCNGILSSEYKLPAFLTGKNFIFEFGNSDAPNNFQIDQLRFINFGNSIETSFESKNYKNFRADSSFILSQFNFDNTDELSSKNENIVITANNLQYVKSNAPIFARAPELNIRILSQSYELEWSGGDFKQADMYILEKSAGKSEYRSIFKIPADNEAEKNYSFLDVQNGSSDIVYYRIKQIDKDGSIVYSSQVKVGQGIQEPFIVEQNYPNPFNPKTSIVVELFEDTEVKVTIYNLEGKEVARLFEGSLSKGLHKFSFDAADQPSGVYLYKVETPKFSQTKKMILTK